MNFEVISLESIIRKNSRAIAVPKSNLRGIKRDTHPICIFKFIRKVIFSVCVGALDCDWSPVGQQCFSFQALNYIGCLHVSKFLGVRG